MTTKKKSTHTSASHSHTHTHAHSAKAHSSTKKPAHAHHAPTHSHSHAHAKKNKKTQEVPSFSTDSLKNVAILVLAIALVAVVILLLTKGGEGTDKESKGTTTSGTTTTSVAMGDVEIPADIVAQMITLADDDAFLGAEDAPVVIVEFSDYECPFCTRFWSDTLPELKKNFIDTGMVKFVYRDLPLSFHANAQKAAEAAECAGEQGKYFEYHDKLFANQQKLDVNSLKTYAADLGLNVAEFNSCLDNGEQAEEVAADVIVAGQYGISGTPGFIINGQQISGALPYDRFEQMICGMLPGVGYCANIKPPVAFEILIINDAKCSTCDTAGIKGRTSELFPGATYREIDASTTEAKELIADNNFMFAPVYLFPPTVEETNTWANQPEMQQFFETTTNGWRLKDQAVGAQWYLSEESQQAALKATYDALDMDPNDGKPQVDFFVMSYCPYGNQAEEILEPVFNQLKGEAYFIPRYVIYNNAGGQWSGCYTDTDGTELCSMHGAGELNQNIRELCVYNDLGEQAWFDFATEMNTACSSANADTCWTDVAEGQGLDTDKIEKCFDDNKVAYAREQYDLNQMLGVGGSPTLFFEGQQYNGARTSNGYLAAICAGFDDNKPAACADVIVEEAPAAVPQGSC